MKTILQLVMWVIHKLELLMFFLTLQNQKLNIILGLNGVNNEGINIVLNIYDLTGKIVKRQQWSNLSNSSFERQIDISSLESGIYMIGLESSAGTREFRKLVKE
ncbi:T9SS type A sorting domain-containing protein [Winogradskyella sp. R77965]|uniref:T9SS type A sorting domain-containing protein n=1 Tax=Winogradskyella sp. R77965 TaxID=3093872 RepID=UPI0037DC3EBA